MRILTVEYTKRNNNTCWKWIDEFNGKFFKAYNTMDEAVSDFENNENSDPACLSPHYNIIER